MYVCSMLIKCARNAVNRIVHARVRVRARVLRTVAPFGIYDAFPTTRERHPQKMFVDTLWLGDTFIDIGTV